MKKLISVFMLIALVSTCAFSQALTPTNNYEFTTYDFGIDYTPYSYSSGSSFPTAPFLLNLLLGFGIGSFVQGDTKAGATALTLDATALGCIISSLVISVRASATLVNDTYTSAYTTTNYNTGNYYYDSTIGVWYDEYGYAYTYDPSTYTTTYYNYPSDDDHDSLYKQYIISTALLVSGTGLMLASRIFQIVKPITFNVKYASPKSSSSSEPTYKAPKAKKQKPSKERPTKPVNENNDTYIEYFSYPATVQFTPIVNPAKESVGIVTRITY